MRYRIINNEYVFGITDTKCKKSYRFSKYDKLNIFSKFIATSIKWIYSTLWFSTTNYASHKSIKNYTYK